MTLQRRRPLTATPRTLACPADGVEWDRFERGYECPQCFARGVPVWEPRRVPMRPVSARRRRENVERRRAMLAAFGTDPACVRCGKPADDAHEPGLRSRGADPTDPAQAIPVCRGCHDAIHASPEQATRDGFMRHSWDKA